MFLVYPVHRGVMCALIMFTASPSNLVSVEELIETANDVTKMALAHEMVVNVGFQIKPTEPAPGRYSLLKTLSIT